MLNAIIKEIVGRSNVTSKVSPHIFRHTFATIALERGMDIVSIQKLLGHESIKATQIYTHVTTDRLKEVYYQSFPRAKKD